MKVSVKYFYYFVFVYSLFSFKIDVIGPVRPDDILLFFSVVVFVFLKDKPSFYGFRYITGSIFIFSIVGMLSVLLGYLNGRIEWFQGFLFVFRHIEYFVFVIIGFYLSYFNFNFKFTFQVYILYVCILIYLQYFGVVSPVSGFSPDRAIANTGGPWEMAAVSSFLALYFYRLRSWIFFMLALSILFMTESRVTLVSTILVLVFYLLYQYPRIVASATSIFSLITVFLLSSAFFYDDALDFAALSSVPVVERIVGLFSIETYNSLVYFFERVPVVQSQAEYFRLTYGEGLSEILDMPGDGSALVRFIRWTILLKAALLDIETVMIGLGPSFADKAVDGAYVRLFIETGLFGLALYFLLVASILFLARGTFITSYVVVLVLTALLIDIFTTYKAMMLLWVFLGRISFDRATRYMESK